MAKHDTTSPDVQPVQLVKLERKTSKASGKQFSVATFGDGQTAYVFDAIEGLDESSFGVPTFKKLDNGQQITAWAVTIPAGKKPEYSDNPKPKLDQAVWDAKDRIIAMEAAQKPAGDIVAALIEVKAIKTLEEVADAYKRLSLVGYNLAMNARIDRIDTDANPLASE